MEGREGKGRGEGAQRSEWGVFLLCARGDFIRERKKEREREREERS